MSSCIMGGVCLCSSWTCRPLWPLFIFLAAAPCFLHCSENPSAVVGKIYPRGNHWAVGHLMGKKSVENLPEQQKASTGSRYLTPSGSVRILEPGQHDQAVEVLQPKKQKQKILRKLVRSSSWREDDREEFLQEMSNLLLLAMKLQDEHS